MSMNGVTLKQAGVNQRVNTCHKEFNTKLKKNDLNNNINWEKKQKKPSKSVPLIQFILTLARHFGSCA